MKKSIIYARVSTEAQAKDCKISLDDQIDRCTSYLKNLGVNEDDIVPIREDFSGFEFNRPRLDEIKKLISQDKIENFVALRVDRISRKPANLDELRETYFIKFGVTVHTPGDLGRWDWSPNHVFLQNSLVNFSELWGRMLIENMWNGKVENVRKGKIFTGGKPTYGYDLTEDGGLVIDHDESRIVKIIFDFYVNQDKSLRWIAKYLNDAGIPTWSDSHSNNFHKKTGKKDFKWCCDVIRRILTNKLYIGEWTFGKTINATKVRGYVIVVPLPEMAIIDKKTFEAAGKKLVENKEMMRQEPKYQYLMRHRIRCACGEPMYCASMRHGRNLYYRCISISKKDHYCNSKRKNFDVNKIDSLIWNWLEELLAEPAKVKQSIKDYLDQIESENSVHRLRQEALNKLMGDAKEAQSRLLDLYESKAIDKTLLIPRMEEYSKKIDDYKTELEYIENTIFGNLQGKEIDYQTLKNWVEFEPKPVPMKQITFADETKPAELNKADTIKKYNVTARIIQTETGYDLAVQCILGKNTFELCQLSPNS